MTDETSHAAPQSTGMSETLGRGVKLLGDTMLVPGTSLLLDGDVAAGALHAVVGVAARVALGPVGWLLVAANAYSKSVSGRGIVSQVLSSKRES